MADGDVIETVETNETSETSAEEAAAFAAGFDGAQSTEVTPPVVPVVAEAPAETIPIEVVPEPAAAVATVQIPESQLKDLLAKVNQVDELKSAIEKLRGDAFGKVGGLERTLKQIQEQTPSGQAIEVKAEDLAELEREFPGLNLGPSLAKDLTKVLSKFKGTGAVTPGLTPDEIDARIAASVQKPVAMVEEARQMAAAERLTDLHEDWQQVIGPADSQTEFRTWLKTKGQDEEQKFLASWDPRFIAKTLTAFKEQKKVREVAAEKAAAQAAAQTPKPSDSRQRRLAEAVPAKGGGIPQAKNKKSEEELAFEEGYANSRS